MNPDNLPSNTEYGMAHLYQSHPYLQIQTGFSIKPIQPLMHKKMKSLPPPSELRANPNMELNHPPMSAQTNTSQPPPPRRSRGRPRGSRRRV